MAPHIIPWGHRDWLMRLLDGRIAHFEAAELGKPFGHEYPKPDIVVVPVPETDPLMQWIESEDRVKELLKKEPRVLGIDTILSGVEARGFSRDHPEFSDQVELAIADLAKKLGGKLQVLPRIDSLSGGKSAEDEQAGTAVFEGNIAEHSSSSPRAQSWSDISIVFVSDHSLQVSINSKVQPPMNYVEFGCGNLRMAIHDFAWETLKELAEREGSLDVASLIGYNRVKSRSGFKRFAEYFGGNFKVDGNPLPFGDDFCYRACFKISCGRAYEA